MIAYLDTSAFVPMMVREPSSEACRDLWDKAGSLVSTRLLHVEATAALARAANAGRIRKSSLPDRLARLEELRQRIQMIELDEPLLENAAWFAATFGLRGYDATHCAAGVAIGSEGSVLASGDRKMLEIWSDLGFSTFDPSRSGSG